MKLLLAIAIAMASAQSAHAYSACNGGSGTVPKPGTTIPPHARIIVYTTQAWRKMDPAPTATIDGKPVKLVVAQTSSAPYRFAIIDVDSDRTGALELKWLDGKEAFTVAATKLSYDAHATTSRFHRKIPHTSVMEIFDGLSIKLDVPAVSAHVRLRRDDKAAWSELDVPVLDGEIQIGKLGCVDNYSPDLLEAGVDLDIALTFVDGRTAPLKGIAHAAIPKLAKPTGTNPTDAE